MVELIQQLLLTNNCVIIPNFGAFIGNYNPAEIRLQQHTILPPNKLIAFNRSLQYNDGLLINAVSQNLSVSYVKAEMKVIDFIKQCNAALAQHKSLIFNDIGKLTTDAENNIQFQPYYSKNYLPESFGLHTLSLQPIERLKDDGGAIKETYQRKLRPELMEDIVTPKKNSKIFSWLTAILAILFIGSSLIWNIHKGNLNQSQSSLIPVFEKSSAESIKKVETVAKPLLVVKDKIKQDLKPVETNLASLSLDNTYVVIGAFFTITRAEKLKTEIEQKGYVVDIIKDDAEKLFHTAIQLDNKEAETAIIKIKTDINPRAWVYCVKCRL